MRQKQSQRLLLAEQCPGVTYSLCDLKGSLSQVGPQVPYLKPGGDGWIQCSATVFPIYPL